MEKKAVNKLSKKVSRRKFIKYGVVSAAGILCSPLVKIAQSGSASVVKIGFPTGLTGFAGPWMAHVKKAVDLVVEEYNAGGGIKSLGGAKVEVLWADTQTNLSFQKSEVEKMINVNKVSIFASGASALEMVSSAVTEKYGAVLVGLATSDDLTSRGMQYYFRTSIKASDNARCSVNFARHMYQDIGKKFKNVAIFHSDDPFGSSAGRTMEDEVRKYPEWNFVERTAYSSAKMVDASDYMSKFSGEGVEILFQSSTPDSGIIIQRGAKTVNFNPQANIHAHGAPYLKGYVNALGKDADYVYCATQFVADMIPKYPKNAQEFCLRFKRRYSEEINDNSACGATTILTIIDAIERAKSADPDKVREALLKTDLNMGDSPYIISGPGVKFDESHHNIKAGTNMHQMRDQNLRCVWPELLKTTEPVWPVPNWKNRG